MSAIFESRELAAEIADKLRVYAQPQRLMILSCLLRGERTVTEIGEITAITQPALSQQLAELRRAKLVSTRKEAKQVWYALADDGVMMCVRSMEAIFSGAEPSTPLSPQPVARSVPTGAAAFAKLV